MRIKNEIKITFKTIEMNENFSKIIHKFNSEQLNIINEFIKSYYKNYNGNLIEFLKKVGNIEQIRDEKFEYSHIRVFDFETEILHVFNDLPISHVQIFDPLYKFYKNADSYMMYLGMNEIENNGCIFIMPTNKLMKMDDEFKNKYYPYYMHAKLMFECAKYYEHIEYDDFMHNSENKIENNESLVLPKYLQEYKQGLNSFKYILLCPYLFGFKFELKTKLKLKNVELSQELPYTENSDFNKFIFELWNKMVDYSEYDDEEIENDDEGDEGDEDVNKLK